MSPEGLLKCSDAELEQAANDREGLQDLFESIWEKVRPLYAGQPKSLQSAEGLSLAHLALRLAAHAQNDRLWIEAWHMMARALSANEEFEKAGRAAQRGSLFRSARHRSCRRKMVQAKP